MKKLFLLFLCLSLFTYAYAGSAFQIPVMNATDGTDGISISDAVVNSTGWLNVTLSNETVLGPWNVTGPQGEAGGGGGYVDFVTNETAAINWTHTFNATDIQKNGVTVLTAETDPYWTGNQSNIYTKAEAETNFFNLTADTLDDIPDGSTYKLISSTNKGYYDTAYSHSQATHDFNATNLTNIQTATTSDFHNIGGSETDPTVDTSAEIQAIIGASVYEPYGVTTTDITDASANGRSIVNATDYAAMRGLLDLEAGTDFYSMTAADTAFEAELDNSAGLLAALNDETGTALSVFSESPTIRNVTITGSLTIAEGALADNVIVSADIKDGTITAADTAITAGRSLTWATNDIAADAELYTDTKCIYWENPVDTDDFKSIWRPKLAATITSIWAESDQTVTFMLQKDDGTPADLDTVDLVPAAGTAEDTALDGDAAFAAGDRLDMAVTSVANTPTWCSVCWTFQYDD